MNNVDEKLFQAIIKGSDEAVEEALIDGANPFEKWSGVSPLALAINKTKLEVFEYLLNVTKGGQELDKNEKIGDDTLLTRILRDPFMPPDFAIALIDSGADVNIVSARGEDPLSLAIQFEKVDEVRALIKAGANIDYVDPNLKITPFLSAARIGNPDIIKVMIDEGVDVNKLNPYGLNALDLIVNAYDIKMTPEEKERYLQTFQLLISSGINYNNVAKSGLTPLWSAAYIGEAMDMLVEAGADIYAEHERGMNKKESFAHFALSNFPETMETNKKDKSGNFIVKVFAPLLRESIYENFRLNYKNSYGNTLEGLLSKSEIDIPENLLAAVEIYKKSDISQMVYPQGQESKTNKNQKIIPMLTALVHQLSEENLLELLKFKVQQGESIPLVVNNKEIIPQFQPISAFIATGKLKALRYIADNTDKNPEGWMVTNKAGKEISAQSLLAKFLTIPKMDVLQAELDKCNAILEGVEINKKNGVTSKIINEDGVKAFKAKAITIEKQLDSLRKYQEESANNLLYAGFKFVGNNKDGIPHVFASENKRVLEIFEKFGADTRALAPNGDNLLVHAILTGSSAGMIDKIAETYKSDVSFWNETWNQLAYHNIGERTTQILVENAVNIITRVFVEDANVVKKEEKDGKENVTINMYGVNHQDEDGNSALMTAIANEYPYYASLMMKIGADVNLANNEGETPVMYAISQENEQLFTKLVEAGASLNVKTNDGVTIDDLLDDVEDKRMIDVVDAALENNLSSMKTNLILKR